MRNTALKIFFALTLLLLACNYYTDMTSGISAYYSEGPTLDEAMRLAHGKNIYRLDVQNPPYTVNNYGPVYFLLQWPFLLWSGPTHLFGNIISLASHLASAWFAGLIVLRLTKKPYARAITSLLVLASPLVGGGLPLYRVDMLAQALSLAGIYAGLTSTTRKGDMLTAVLFATSVYTKLTYAVCGPASVFFFHLLQGNRRQAFRQGLLLAFTGLALLGLMQWLTAGGFFFNIVTANQIQYSLLRALRNWETIYPQIFIASLAVPQLWQNNLAPSQAKRWRILSPAPSLRAAPCAVISKSRNDLNTPPLSARLFASTYLFFAACAAMASGKIGANYGYFGELQVALACVLGIAATPYVDSMKLRLAPNCFVWGQMAVYLYFLLASPYHHYLRTNHADLVALKEKIQAEPGIVLADDYLGMVVLTGKPLYFEANAMTQLYYKGEWSQDRFVRELRDGKFSMILLGEYNLRKARWTPEMLAAIHERYHLAEHTREADIWLRNQSVTPPASAPQAPR